MSLADLAVKVFTEALPTWRPCSAGMLAIAVRQELQGA